MPKTKATTKSKTNAATKSKTKAATKAKASKAKLSKAKASKAKLSKAKPTKAKAKAKPTKPTPTKAKPARSSKPIAYRLRRSPVHGTGLFATRAITNGEEIIEYAGERITHEEADRRHEHKAGDDNHTFLFTIDAKIVVDGGVGGNDSRFINHSCDPNCEVLIDNGRLFVEAVRAIEPGEELAYDYNLTRATEDLPEVERIFACRCGAACCRGTMLAPIKKPKPALEPGAKRPGSAGKKAGGRKKAAA